MAFQSMFLLVRMLLVLQPHTDMIRHPANEISSIIPRHVVYLRTRPNRIQQETYM